MTLYIKAGPHPLSWSRVFDVMDQNMSMPFARLS